VHGAWKGLALGAVNVLVIAIGLAVAEKEATIAVLVVMFGGMPGLVAGAVLGVLAGMTSTIRPPIRVAILALTALGVVYGLAHEFGLQELALVSSIPTVVAALILERWTRHVEAPPVPVARAIAR